MGARGPAPNPSGAGAAPAAPTRGGPWQTGAVAGATGLRLAAAPAVMALCLAADYLPALLVFVAAAATDYLDGYLARRWRVTTATGTRWAGVCGELAGDPLATELLIGLGVRELSAAPRLVPGIKEAVRATTLARARRLAERALRLPDAEAVRELLEEPRR